MKFRFELAVQKIPWPVTHRHQLMLMGSCFTENIGEKLQQAKFRVLENPHGILFNPVSVAEALTDCISNRSYDASTLFYLNEAYHSWQHHSRFSGITPEAALHAINTSIGTAHTFLQQADYLFITLGSAWTYRFTDQAMMAAPGRVAANNHKAPANWFRRTLLSATETAQVLTDLIGQLNRFNPALKILFTISPVRHLREGAVDNNRSKAVLIQAVHSVVEAHPQCYYFPAYELVIDDLRDYRFFAEDLVHPNYAATQYVWEKLTGACMSNETQQLMEELNKIRLAFNHKPFHAASAGHRQFLDTYRNKVQQMAAQHPYIDLEKELRYFSSVENS